MGVFFIFVGFFELLAVLYLKRMHDRYERKMADAELEYLEATKVFAESALVYRQAQDLLDFAATRKVDLDA